MKELRMEYPLVIGFDIVKPLISSPGCPDIAAGVKSGSERAIY